MGVTLDTSDAPDPPPPTALLAQIPETLRARGGAGAGLHECLPEGLLDDYFCIVLTCVLRRVRGDGPRGVKSLPPLELPRALRPFMRMRPEHAVAQSAVRGALLDLADDDAALRVMVGEEVRTAFAAAHPGAPVPLVDVVAQAVAGADATELAVAVTLAIATGGDDAAAALTVATAAALAARRRADADEAATRAAVASQRRHEEQTVSRLRTDLQRATDAARRAEDALAEAKARRDQLRGDLSNVTRQATEADAARQEAEARAAERHAEIAVLQESVRRERAASREGLEREARLRQALDRVRAQRIPDLDGPAAELEELAARLRRLQEMPVDAEQADFVAVDDDAEPGASARRVPTVPKGMLPDTTAFVRWALTQPGLAVLVDGYNVCLQAERGWSELRGDALRDLLTARLAAAHRPGGAEFVVVFDGDGAVASKMPAARRFPDGVRWEFTHGTTADDRLVELSAALSAGRTIVVVTSDRELQSRVSAEGAVVVSSPVLLESVGAPQRR